MGRIIGLELFNFKSYRGLNTIGFGDACFTSIIGPNGAGKSNMMDAISFVLGVKSSHLRTQNIKDLIYRGRVDGDESFAENPTRAHVKLVYEVSDGETVELKRTIASSGSTEYKIDDKSVTALQYTTLLKKENILIKARNFLVFQGDVESIASQSPIELTQLVETISGSIEYAKEYDSLKEEVAKAQEYSNNVFSKKKSLNSESRQFKEQLEEQEAFEQKLTEKHNLIKIINLYKLYHNQSQHDQLQSVIGEKEKSLKSLKKKLSSEEEKHARLTAQYSKRALEGKAFNQNISAAKQSLESVKRSLIPVDGEKKSLSNKITSCTNKIKDITVDIEKKTGQVSDLQSKLNEAKKLYKRFEEKINSSIASTLSPEAHKEYELLRAQFLSSGGSQLEQQLSLLKSEMESITTTIDINKDQRANLTRKIDDLESEINGELKSELDFITTEINDILSMRSEKLALKNRLVQERDEFNYKEMEINSQLRDILIKIDELSSRQRESNRQKRARENVAMLKRLVPGGAIKGLVYDLIQPSQQKYTLALQTLLGKNFDSIIVETTAVAHKCIEMLKERRAGVATFIPLDSIVFEPINLSYLRSIHPQAQPGVDVVDFVDDSLEQAAHFIIGNALVVENIQLARQLKWDNSNNIDGKIVTIDGSVINKSGLMTGGHGEHPQGAALNWDKNELVKMNNLKEELTSKLNDLNDKKPKEMDINMVQEDIIALDDKLPLLRDQKESVERMMGDKQRELEFQQDAINQLKSVAGVKESELHQLESKESSLNSEIQEIEKEVYSDFCKSNKFKNGIQDYESLHGSALRTRTKERTQYVKAISSLNNQLQFEEDSFADLKTRKSNLEKQLVKHERRLEEIVKEREEIASKWDELEAQLDILREQRTEFDRAQQDELKTVASLESEVKELTESTNSIFQEISNTKEDVLGLNMSRVNMLKNCKIDNVMVPLKDGFLESISLNSSLEKLASNIYETVRVDYEMLNDKLREKYTAKAEAELQARLEQVIEDLDRLTPNGKAMERLKATEKKLRNFDKDFTKARQQENKATEKFNEVKQLRLELFMEAFKHIADQIDHTYKELTRTNATPLGGSAYLTLEDDAEPYTAGIKYHAMPPMKRFSDMDLLSGGEKTIAALALLFAIHSFQPSPFFILDEVDAALDSRNVSKIANYIKKISGPSFQFIVISLKNALFEKSDSLVGIYREQQENSSKTITLDLRDYPEEETALVGTAA